MKQPENNRKKYDITLEMIAKWFNYSTTDSLKNSSAKEDMIKGVDNVVRYVENHIIDKISS